VEIEKYDPKQHTLVKLGPSYGGKWRERFEAALEGPLVIREDAQSSISGMAKRLGYKARTHALADGSGFVLWAEKLP